MGHLNRPAVVLAGVWYGFCCWEEVVKHLKSETEAAMREELKIIRTARKNGIRLKIEPMLYDSPCILMRERCLEGKLK